MVIPSNVLFLTSSPELCSQMLADPSQIAQTIINGQDSFLTIN